MSLDTIARAARELHEQARARVDEIVRTGGHVLNGICAAFQLHDVEVWTGADLIAVAGAMLRLAPQERPELLVEAARAWHVARGGTVDDDDLGEERGSA